MKNSNRFVKAVAFLMALLMSLGLLPWNVSLNNAIAKQQDKEDVVRLENYSLKFILGDEHSSDVDDTNTSDTVSSDVAAEEDDLDASDNVEEPRIVQGESVLYGVEITLHRVKDNMTVAKTASIDAKGIANFNDIETGRYTIIFSNEAYACAGEDTIDVSEKTDNSTIELKKLVPVNINVEFVLPDEISRLNEELNDIAKYLTCSINGITIKGNIKATGISTFSIEGYSERTYTISLSGSPAFKDISKTVDTNNVDAEGEINTTIKLEGREYTIKFIENYIDGIQNKNMNDAVLLYHDDFSVVYTAETGYQIESAKIVNCNTEVSKNIQINDGKSVTVNIEKIDADYEVQFDLAVLTYTLSIKDGGIVPSEGADIIGGSININGTSISNLSDERIPKLIQEGQPLTITAKADDNYCVRLIEATGRETYNNESRENKQEYKIEYAAVDKAVTYTFAFAKRVFSVSLDEDSANDFAIKGGSSISAEYMSTTKISIIPKENNSNTNAAILSSLKIKIKDGESYNEYNAINVTDNLAENNDNSVAEWKTVIDDTGIRYEVVISGNVVVDDIIITTEVAEEVSDTSCVFTYKVLQNDMPYNTELYYYDATNNTLYLHDQNVTIEVSVDDNHRLIRRSTALIGGSGLIDLIETEPRVYLDSFTVNMKDSTEVNFAEIGKSFIVINKGVNNTSAWNYNMRVIVDTTAPEVKIAADQITSEDGEWKWTNEDVKLSYNAKDTASGIKFCRLEKQNANGEWEAVDAEGDDAMTYAFKDEQDCVYRVYSEDKVSNMAIKEVHVMIDKTVPYMPTEGTVPFRFTKNSNDVLGTIVHYISGGLFCNESIVLEIMPIDPESNGAVSGLGVCDVNINGNNVATLQNAARDDSSVYYSIELDNENFAEGSEVSVIAHDIAGNQSAKWYLKIIDDQMSASTDDGTLIYINEENNAQIMLELPSNGLFVDTEDCHWYSESDIANSDSCVNYEVKDEIMGIQSVSLKLNDSADDGAVTDTYTGTNVVGNAEASVPLNSFNGYQEGRNTISVHSTNNAGVESKETYIDVYYDSITPEISSCAVAVAEKTPLSQVINAFTFGTFSNDDVKITIGIEDGDKTSGIKTVEMILSETGSEVELSQSICMNFESESNGVKYYTYTISKSKIASGAYLDYNISFRAVDNVNNCIEIQASDIVNSGIQGNRLIIEENAPTLDINNSSEHSYMADEVFWTVSSDIKIEVNANDKIDSEYGYSGINSIQVTVQKITMSQDGEESAEEIFEHSFDYSHSFVPDANRSLYDELGATFEEDGKYIVNVTATDNAGNTTNEEYVICVDNDSPKLTVTLPKDISEQNWYSKTSKIDIAAVDTWNGADGGVGIDWSTFSIDSVKVRDSVIGQSETLANNNYSEYFTISENAEKRIITVNKDGIYEFNFSICDMLGNKFESVPTNIKQDTKAPTFESELPAAPYIKDGMAYYKDVEYKFTASDDTSGLSDKNNVIVAYSNGRYTTENNIDGDVNGLTTEYNRAFNGPDGIYTIQHETINAKGETVPAIKDNAGNCTEIIDDITFCIDNTVPQIAEFVLPSSATLIKNPDSDEIAENGIEIEEGSNPIGEYSYFFKDEGVVKIYAVDEFSGVKNVYFETRDIYGNTTITHKGINQNGYASFTVNANFKGRIYAYAEDNLGNIDSTKKISPDKVIAETAAHHKEYAHIKLENITNVKEKVDWGDDKQQQAKDMVLFNKNQNISVTVNDEYNGIREIDWYLMLPDGTVKSSESVWVADYSGKDWKSTTSEGITTELSRNIIIEENYNGMTLHIKMVDGAGHITVYDRKISIDKTEPEISVTYDNNSAQNGTYYNGDRTATITITERSENFNKDNVICVITNSDYQTVPKINSIKWENRNSNGNGDSDKHTAKITYSADGNYEFEIGFTDNAGNAAATVKDKFIIDKTAPIVKVEYANKKKQNEKYFNDKQYATITIEEHNLNEGDISIIGTATDDGSTLRFPSISKWNKNGDTYTAKIEYLADAKYTFDIECMDLAGNKIADYSIDEFYVDTTAPKVSITNIVDKSANNAEIIAPVVSYSDTNIDESNVKITLTGSRLGILSEIGTATPVHNGKVFTLNNIENDDIYDLRVEATDKAGNVTTDSVKFSVNREGSTFENDEKTQKIVDTRYCKSVSEIGFYEVNVDNIDENETAIIVTVNGNTMNVLTANDYSVNKEEDDGNWSRYHYIINGSVFSEDGMYSITVKTVDAAGNENYLENSNIVFFVDSKKPDVSFINVRDNEQYDKKLTVDVKIADLALNEDSVSVEIFNDRTHEGYMAKIDSDGDTYRFNVDEKNYKQSIKLVAKDFAGNEETVEVSHILVSGNWFIRFINNTLLFGITIGAIAIIGAAVAGVIIVRKKRNLT